MTWKSGVFSHFLRAGIKLQTATEQSGLQVRGLLVVPRLFFLLEVIKVSKDLLERHPALANVSLLAVGSFASDCFAVAS